ncbi:ATP-binding protein [Thiorhodovibrio winogradskyi]|nr:ATP-binding protein [Thiorhodovibrio winogradskyi]
MIPRLLESRLRELAGYYPVVAVIGPRQSGKTTLCRMVFPDRPYVSFEALDTRAFAAEDPRAFLRAHQYGAVFDEVQRVPELLSYLQTEVDEDPEPGRFVLTGSQHLGLAAAISQSLAGRCGLLTLLPPSLDELRRFPNAPDDLYSLLFQGAYPRIYDRDIPASRWLADYVATYIQRDVRQMLNVGDLNSFTGFPRLCAGRSAREINLSALGADAGITHNTARAWLSVLETSFILLRLPAWHLNLRKQLIKAPKLHLFDTGLLCHLLGIQDQEQLHLHPLRGAIFETWVVSEVYKAFTHRGTTPALFHYRESRGLEVDLLLEQGLRLNALEMKSAATLAPDFFRNLQGFRQRLAGSQPERGIGAWLVYGGDESQSRSQAKVLSWRDIGQIGASLA